MKPPRIVILDFDGVVVESNAVKTAAFADVFARFPEHFDRAMEYHRAHVSRSRFEKFDFLVRECLERGDDTLLRQELAEEFSRRTIDRVVACEFVPGAEEFLATFSATTALYLASVTPQEDLDTILSRRQLAAYFRDAYGCPPWNKELAIRDILRREGAAADEAVLVGDSDGDRKAAAATGVAFVARNSGLRFEVAPEYLYPDLHAVARHLRLT